MNKWAYIKIQEENAELRELLGLDPVTTITEKSRLMWGHCERKHSIHATHRHMPGKLQQ